MAEGLHQLVKRQLHVSSKLNAATAHCHDPGNLPRTLLGSVLGSNLKQNNLDQAYAHCCLLLNKALEFLH